MYIFEEIGYLRRVVMWLIWEKKRGEGERERVTGLQGPTPVDMVLGRARAGFGSDTSYCDSHWFVSI